MDDTDAETLEVLAGSASRVLFIRDPDRNLLMRIESIAEEQRRRHPGSRSSIASVARELLEHALLNTHILDLVRR